MNKFFFDKEFVMTKDDDFEKSTKCSICDATVDGDIK